MRRYERGSPFSGRTEGAGPARLVSTPVRIPGLRTLLQAQRLEFNHPPSAPLLPSPPNAAWLLNSRRLSSNKQTINSPYTALCRVESSDRVLGGAWADQGTLRMHRRTLLEWVSRGLATGVMSLIGLPGLRYLVGGFSTTAAEPASFRRLKRLKDLPVGKATLVPVLGYQQDAWTRGEEQVIGRVWLVRQASAGNESSADPTATPVVAFTSVCPHMGCQIQAHLASGGFTCPCHRASFDAAGKRRPDPTTGGPNPSPREMDALECRIQPDPATGEAWIEVKLEKFVVGSEHREVVRS